MKIISSQHYLDWNIVEEKRCEIEGMESIEVLCCEIGEIDKDPDGLEGEEYLSNHYMDGDWYDVEKSDPSEERFCLVW